jgi:hypothetical protein
MIGLVTFLVFAACVVGLMCLIGYGSKRLVMRLGINPKIFTTIIIVVVFLIY